jgi:hypothetical protein
MIPTLGGILTLLPTIGFEIFPAVAAPPWWPSALPSPEVTAAVLVGMLVFAVVAVVVVVRVVVPLGIRVGGVLRRTWQRVAPKSTFGKVMTIFTLLFLLSVVPTMFTLVDAKGSLEGVSRGSSAIAEMDGDAIVYATDGDATVARPAPDRDGDRLLDSWERAGETPDGVPLPGASVGRKDLYVQVLYSKSVAPLDASERADLRRIWARMPVENPDGSTGISLHLVDERRLDRTVSTYEPDAELVRARYGGDHLRGGECVYYQTTFAEITHPNLGGRAALGGYTSMVDGTDETVRANRTNRVAFLTHELLHNTAGSVEGRPHTESGWLSPTYDGSDARLSPATAAALESGFAVGVYEERHLCDG